MPLLAFLAILLPTPPLQAAELKWRGVYPKLTESLEATRQHSVTYHQIPEEFYIHLTNRVLIPVDWTVPVAGTYSLQAEITAASGSSVLDPVPLEHRFLSPPSKPGR